MNRPRAACLLAFHLAASLAFAQPALQEGFRAPPPVARPHTWWHWMNGNVSKAGITADLEAMKAAGLGGAQIFNPSEGIPDGPVLYNSPQWRSLVVFAATEADRLGLELCVHDCAGWSSSGGPWVKPEQAMQTVVFSEVKARQAPGGVLSVKLPQPRTVAGYYRDIAVLAFPTPKNDGFRIADLAAKAMYESRYGQEPSTAATPADAAIPAAAIVDVTGKMRADGTLEWDAENPPKTEWTIIRFGHTCTGAVNAPSPASGRGLEVDKMSRPAFDAFWAGGMAPLLKELGPLVGRSFKHCLVDSYEVGSQNWTPEFRSAFEDRRGYDPLMLLPVMTGRVVGDGATSERFLWDLRRTVGDLFADHYYSYFAQTCRANGLLASIEPYDGPFECTQVARDADIVMGEFWTNGGMNTSCKLAASVAHTYGKPIVGAESYTAFPDVGKWMNTPASLKAVGDLMFTVGINRDIIHRYAHQPWEDVNPGMTMGQWGTHFERTTTWWGQGRAWLDYLARCQFMLQQGVFVADALLLAGEASPNNAPQRDDLKAAGYDYDACSPEIILKHASVKDGRIRLDSGMSYRLLVLPESPFMTPALLAKVRDLVRDGATVLGPRPSRSPSLRDQPAADGAVAALAAELWADCDGVKVKSRAFGKGSVRCGEDALAVLASLAPPDVTARSTRGGAAGLAWIHRAVGDADVYFLSNQKPRTVEVECSFRVQGKAPQLWNAESGETAPAAVWSSSAGRTTLPLRLEPSGSVFVVFTPAASPVPHFTAVRTPADDREPPVPALAVTKAVYEAIDGAGSVDVTAKAAALVASGELAVPASNGLFGDPAFNHLKQLRIEFTVDGKPRTLTVAENATAVLLDLVFPELPPICRADAARGELTAFRPGRYELTDAAGRTVAVDIAPDRLGPAREIPGPWVVDFQPGRGAPASATMPSLASLSKSDVPGIRYFSGTASYETTFDLPAPALTGGRVHTLSLGVVRDLAEVTLNGKDLGVWWKPPFSADVTAILRAGTNTLRVRVTNTWVNRLIGDEQFPDDCEWNGITIKAWPKWFDSASAHPLANRPVKERLTFTTWKHWHKDSPLPDSGLIGPVRLESGARAAIK